jgi:hypothetical protein
MKEKAIESYLVNRVAQLGGVALKLKWLGGVGFPDRVCLFPRGRIAFAELKRPVGGRKGAHQGTWNTYLRKLGFDCQFISTLDGVDAFLKPYQTL